MVSTTTQLDDEAAEAEKRFEPIRGKVRTERYTAQPTSIENGPIESESEHRTYLIIGNGRGGTSMVAGVAHLLGLELNAPKGGGFEDHDFTRVSQGLVPEGPPLPLDLSPEEITARLRATVELRNSQHDVWGWKDPSADLYFAGPG